MEIEIENLRLLWGGMEYLDPEQAAALVCGVIPYSYAKGSGTHRMLSPMEYEIDRAMDLGDLESVLRVEVEGPLFRGEGGLYVPRDRLREWCEKRGFSLGLLTNKVSTAKDSGDVLYPAAAHSLLAIILALCDLAEVNLKRPHSSKAGNGTEEILARMEGLRIERAPSARTVADWLQRARKLQER